MKCRDRVWKNQGRLWRAVARPGKRFLDGGVGCRAAESGRKPGHALKSNDLKKVLTDYCSPYEKFIPEQSPSPSKAETFTVEGWNSGVRPFLARLRRKSTCHGKSQDMLDYSGMPLMLNGMDN
jgi:insertion element IS1 protein InsB